MKFAKNKLSEDLCLRILSYIPITQEKEGFIRYTPQFKMKIVDFFTRTGKKPRCMRCKKVLQDGEFKQKGECCFCLECVVAEEKIFPEHLLLRTPSILKDGAQVTKTLTCPICKKETPNPFFHSPSKIDSPYHYTWIGEQRLCYLCARKQILASKESDNTLKEGNYFFYPMSDSSTEASYWSNAVSQANSERSNKDLNEHPDFFEMVDHIIIYEYKNPNNEDMMDDSTSLYIYANPERTLWCFKLVNDYISGWDGWPVWMGGFITPKQFLEFMDKMQLKHHLFLFENANM